MEDRIKKTYDEMCQISNINVDNLTTIYNANRNYFSPEIIDLIVGLGTKTVLTFVDLLNYSRLASLSMFSKFITAHTEDDTYRQYHSVISEYLRSISLYKKINFNTLRNSVMFWLRCKMEQPNIAQISPTQCRASIKSTYKPFVGSQTSASNDLLSKLNNQIEQLKRTQLCSFNYVPRSTTVNVSSTNLLSNVVNKLIHLQTLMNREASNQNIKISAFLDIVPISSKTNKVLGILN